jgi:hypothetical protein
MAQTRKYLLKGQPWRTPHNTVSKASSEPPTEVKVDAVFKIQEAGR